MFSFQCCSIQIPWRIKDPRKVQLHAIISETAVPEDKKMETSIKCSFHGSFIKQLKIQKLYTSFVESSMRYFIPKATFSDLEKKNIYQHVTWVNQDHLHNFAIFWNSVQYRTIWWQFGKAYRGPTGAIFFTLCEVPVLPVWPYPLASRG